MNGRGKHEWQRRQRFEIVGGMPSTGNPEGRPYMSQKALRRHIANQGSQPRPGVAATVAIPGMEFFMNDDQTIISLLTEIRDLLRGGGVGATAVAATNSQATQAFTAETLTATVDDGKVYWKIRGGMFKKFGVTVWPETLAAAGFDAETISPLKSHDLTGYTAVYVLNEEGKAQKVIQLIPPPKPTAVSASTTAKTNGRTAAAAKTEKAEPSFFRPGDKVKATDATGEKHTAVVTGTVGSDGKIAVKVGEKIYRLELSKVEMVEPAF